MNVKANEYKQFNDKYNMTYSFHFSAEQMSEADVEV